MFEWLFQRLVAWVLGFFGGVKAVGDDMLTWLVSTVTGYLPDAAGALEPSDIQELLGQINYFLPISEIVVYGLAYAALWALVVAYRFGKSWFGGSST